MKSIAFTIVIIAFLGLLAYTNPTLESYERFLHQEIIQEVKKQSGSDLEQVFGSFLGGVASRFAASQTLRKDYVFMSTYDTELGDEHLRVLGILNNFIVLEMPESLKDSKGQNQQRMK